MLRKNYQDDSGRLGNLKKMTQKNDEHIMTGKVVPEINIDEIMEKIRAEVAARKANAADNSSGKLSDQGMINMAVRRNVDRGMLWRFIKKAQYRLGNYPFYGFVYRIAIRFKGLIPQNRYYIPLSEITKYHDEEFIRNVYLCILQRDPDSLGLDCYLQRLRNKRLTKIEIIGIIRYSKEGRKIKAPVKGLLLRHYLGSLRRRSCKGCIL
jgi:hypothetical protein